MISYSQIEKVNSEIKPTEVKGNDYAKVAERVKAFRKLNPEGSIVTELISFADGVCVMKATILNGEGSVLATGTAYEKESTSFINKLSMIENCETSCVGRALGFCGYGIDMEIASADEVETVKTNVKEAMKEHQEVVEEDAKARARVLKFINDNEEPKVVLDYFVKEYGCKPDTANLDALNKFIEKMKKNGKQI